MPSHVPGSHCASKVLDLEVDELMLLNQRNHCSCAPVTDHVEIYGKIPAPLPGEGRALLLTRTEGYPDGATCCRHLGNVQGMGQAGLQGALLSCVRSPLSSALALRNSSLLSAPPQAPPGALVGVISALSLALQVYDAPLAPAAAEVEWNVHGACKSCSWTDVERCGSTARMEEEKREQVVALLTRIGMMAEDLSLIALKASEMSDEVLDGLVEKIQQEVLAMKLLSEEADEVRFYDKRTN